MMSLKMPCDGRKRASTWQFSRQPTGPTQHNDHLTELFAAVTPASGQRRVWSSDGPALAA